MQSSPPASAPDTLTKKDRDGLIMEHLEYTKKLANQKLKQLPSHADREEIIAAAQLGLVEAANNFNPSKSDNFKKYAYTRINGAICDCLRSYDPMSRRGRQIKQVRKRVTDQIAQTQEVRPNQVSDMEIAKVMGVPLQKFRNDRVATQSVSLLDDLPPQVAESVLGRPEAYFLPAERCTLIKKLFALGELDERQQLAIINYYWEGKTQKEIGVILGVVESRVCQILKKAIEKMQAALRENRKKAA